jgi:hypothetical protein
MQNNSNSINIRYNRFKANTKYGILNFENFNFEKGLKSINSKKLYFINNASSESEEVYDYIINVYLMFLDKDYSFFDEFVCDELIPDYKADRLLNIIKEVQNVKYRRKDLQNIFKLKNNKDKKLHFFIRKSRNNLSLILIDLYHMGVYGDNIVNGVARTIPMEKIYKRYKNNEVKLDKIKEMTL